MMQGITFGDKLMKWEALSRFVVTFSSAVLLRKQTNASENCVPQGPLRSSATQGHSKAFCALSSKDCKRKYYDIASNNCKITNSDDITYYWQRGKSYSCWKALTLSSPSPKAVASVRGMRWLDHVKWLMQQHVPLAMKETASNTIQTCKM